MNVKGHLYIDRNHTTDMAIVCTVMSLSSDTFLYNSSPPHHRWGEEGGTEGEERL